MKVDDHPRGEAREDIEKRHGDVRVHEAAVGAVDEEDVARLEMVEQVQVNRFQPFADHFVAEPVDLAPRLRVQRDQTGLRAVRFDGPANEAVETPEPTSKYCRGRSSEVKPKMARPSSGGTRGLPQEGSCVPGTGCTGMAR